MAPAPPNVAHRVSFGTKAAPLQNQGLRSPVLLSHYGGRNSTSDLWEHALTCPLSGTLSFQELVAASGHVQNLLEDLCQNIGNFPHCAILDGCDAGAEFCEIDGIEHFAYTRCHLPEIRQHEADAHF